MEFKSKNLDPNIAEFTEAVWVGGIRAQLEDLHRLDSVHSWADLAELLSDFEYDPDNLLDFKSYFDITENSEWYDVFVIVDRIIDWAELQQAAKEWYKNAN